MRGLRSWQQHGYRLGRTSMGYRIGLPTLPPDWVEAACLPADRTQAGKQAHPGQLVWQSSGSRPGTGTGTGSGSVSDRVQSFDAVLVYVPSNIEAARTAMLRVPTAVPVEALGCWGLACYMVERSEYIVWRFDSTLHRLYMEVAASSTERPSLVGPREARWLAGLVAQTYALDDPHEEALAVLHGLSGAHDDPPRFRQAPVAALKAAPRDF